MYTLYTVNDKYGRTRHLVTLNEYVVSIGRGADHFRRMLDNVSSGRVTTSVTKEQWLSIHKHDIVDMQFMETSFNPEDILKTIKTLNLLGN